ncbi:esterase-like activity of phytase family protein [Aurantiacibacter sediminis]|uniref:Esterase-like activity of phytase family protein n=1 Tax=Aurantiacibacter sediminis TaxID=2793064 RepID=A0ABS0N0I7_9SPHN|nr:esterase-like activity of phytase family protein [Aurantiacibacter sediminis]MBH5321469.1 esterase-like activity of phytase family protein [Aurantiacibacter sediminis]
MLSSIRRRKRLVLLIVIGVLLLVLSWWRSPVSLRPSDHFNVTQLAVPKASGQGQVTATHVWEVNGSGAGFGGFSALIAMPNDQLRAFSDRNWRLTFTMEENGPAGMNTAQVIPADGFGLSLFDIEAATSAPDGSAYWLSYEATHAIHRYGADDSAEAVRLLEEELSLPLNAGLEALVRLADGQFLAFAEGQNDGYVFTGDPADGAELASFPVEWPVADYRPTDASQLPDGRVLVLMRRFSPLPLPTFESLLVVGESPVPDAIWRPQLLASLEGIVPRENYEGLAVRPLPGGAAELWLISDDNFSAFQRTLLARLVYAP